MNENIVCECGNTIWDNSKHCRKCGKDYRVYKIGYVTNDLESVSSGLNANCEECAGLYGYDITTRSKRREFSYKIENQEFLNEGNFSHSPCDECNTPFGGNSFIAHGIDSDGELIHFSICEDCSMEFAGNEIDRITMNKNIVCECGNTIWNDSKYCCKCRKRLMNIETEEQE